MRKWLLWTYRVLTCAGLFAGGRMLFGMEWPDVFDYGYWMMIMGAITMAGYDLLGIGEWIRGEED